MQKYAIIGYPLQHSLSPIVHSAVFKKMDIAATYEKLEINPAGFDIILKNLKSENFSGFNVTLPYKTRIIDYLDELDPLAESANAVNTIAVNNKRWKGYNTDITGFIHPLKKLKSFIKNSIVFGSGGAAKAVIISLLNLLDVKKIVILGRTVENLNQIRKLFGKGSGDTILVTDSIQNYTAYLADANLVVNATPLGMSPDIENSVLPSGYKVKPGTVFYDLVYNPRETLFLKQAKQNCHDAVLIGGVDMFSAQAAAAFKIWTGKDLAVDMFIPES